MNDIPPELMSVKTKALRALAPVIPINSNTKTNDRSLYSFIESKASQQLPSYYLLYFLFVEFLGFMNLGKSEKIAWSVPIDYEGKAFLIEHRKFGVGVFIQDVIEDEKIARKIVIKIQNAVKVTHPFFDWMANQGMSKSLVNINNNSQALFARFKYFRDAFQSKHDEAEHRKYETVRTNGTNSQGFGWESFTYPAFQINKEASWLAISAIEAFFSWTEHVFIHLVIIFNGLTKTNEILDLFKIDWPSKYKKALDINIPNVKKFFDSLCVIRKELRNFIAHGTFGKNSEAFSFHSGVGAVPVLLTKHYKNRKFILDPNLSFNAESVIKTIDDFIVLLWSEPRNAAKIYLQETNFPIILTKVSDGTYAKVLKSPEKMIKFVEYLAGWFDHASNMDW